MHVVQLLSQPLIAAGAAQNASKGSYGNLSRQDTQLSRRTPTARVAASRPGCEDTSIKAKSEQPRALDIGLSQRLPKAKASKKLQPWILHRRIRSAESLWGLRSACRHVGYAFNTICLCAAMSQLHHLYARTLSPLGKTQSHSPAANCSNTSAYMSTASSIVNISSSPPSPASTTGASLPSYEATPPLTSTPSPSTSSLPPNPSQLDLMIDTLDCLMLHLDRIGGIQALDPMGLAIVAHVLGHLLPAIPIQQPPAPRAKPQAPAPLTPSASFSPRTQNMSSDLSPFSHANGSPAPSPPPHYRRSMLTRLSLASQFALTTQPLLHTLNAQQLAMLLTGLAKLRFQPSQSWRLAFYRASAAQLRQTARKLAARSAAEAQLSGSADLQHKQHMIEEGLQAGGLLDTKGLSGKEAWDLPAPSTRGRTSSPKLLHNHKSTGTKVKGSSSTNSSEQMPKSERVTSKSGQEALTLPAPAPGLVSSFSSMLWALVHLGVHPPSAWLHASLTLCTPYLPCAQPHELSTLTWALGSLCYQLPPACVSTILSTTSTWLHDQQQQTQLSNHRLQQQSQQQQPRGQANAATDLAQVVPSPDPDATTSIAAPSPSMGHWSVSHRIMLLWGLAQMTVPLPVPWMEHFLGALLQSMKDTSSTHRACSTSTVAMLVYALAKLQRTAKHQRLKERQSRREQRSLHKRHEAAQEGVRQVTDPAPSAQQPGSAGSNKPTALAQHQLEASSHVQPINQQAPSPAPSVTQSHSTLTRGQYRALKTTTQPLQPSLAPKLAHLLGPTQQQHRSSNLHTRPSPQASALRLHLMARSQKQHVQSPHPCIPQAACSRRVTYNQHAPASHTSLPCLLPKPSLAPLAQQTEQQQGASSLLHHTYGPYEPEYQVWHVSCSALGKQLIQEVLVQCVTQAHAQLPNCSSRTLVTLLWSLGKLGVRPHPSFLANTMHLLRQRWSDQDAGLPASSSRHLVPPPLSTATTHLETETSGGAALANFEGGALLDGECARNSKHVSAWDICMLAYSLACLKVQPSPDWHASLLEAARLRMREATPMQLSNLAWGLKVMRAQPRMHWLLELWHVLAAVEGGLGNAELNQVAHAWVALPGSHSQRVILAQHFPQLLWRILYQARSAPNSTGKAIFAQAPANRSRAAAAPARPALTSVQRRRAQVRNNGRARFPRSQRHLLVKALKEGLARRNGLQQAKRSAARCAMRLGAGRKQPKQRLRLVQRLQRVELAMLALRQSAKQTEAS